MGLEVWSLKLWIFNLLVLIQAVGLKDADLEVSVYVKNIWSYYLLYRYYFFSTESVLHQKVLYV